MAATIRLVDGTEATLVDQSGTWECDNPDVKDHLEFVTKRLPYDYYPDPIGDVARKVAAWVGAKVIHADPAPRRVDGVEH